MGRLIPPLTDKQRAAVANALAYVEQMLVLRQGVPDADRLIRLYHSFVAALALTTPPSVIPGDDVIRQQQNEFFSDREIDLVLKEMETIAVICAGHMTAKVSDAHHKLRNKLVAMRGREGWAQQQQE
jgi:hypothetical protein